MRDKIRDALKIAIDEATEVLLGDATDAMVDFLSGQPYSVACFECGEELVYIKEFDCDGDMNLSISPCKCQDGE